MPTLCTPAQQRYLSATQDGRRFLSGLPARVEGLCQDLGLKLLGPAGGGATSVALAVGAADGRRLVLKLDPDEQRASAAAIALHRWSLAGVAPPVLASGGGWCLMEWVEGETLQRPLGDVGRAASCAVQALSVAWAVKLPQSALTDRFAWVLPLSEVRLQRARHPAFPPSLARRAQELLPALLSYGPAGACHGDPVGGNIIVGPSGAKLIDPVPHLGPLEALVAHWSVRARDGRDSPSLAEFMRVQAGLALDAEQVRVWSALHALTFAAYLLSQGRGVSEELVALVSPLHAT